jgi:hypothetical protein
LVLVAVDMVEVVDEEEVAVLALQNKNDDDDDDDVTNGAITALPVKGATCTSTSSTTGNSSPMTNRNITSGFES